MSSIVGEDNTSRSQDERTIYTASELVSRELSELKTLRNEIFEKEVKSLLAEVKEKIIEKFYDNHIIFHHSFFDNLAKFFKS